MSRKVVRGPPIFFFQNVENNVDYKISKNKKKNRLFLAINKRIFKNLTLHNSKSVRISTLGGQIPIDTMSLDLTQNYRFLFPTVLEINGVKVFALTEIARKWFEIGRWHFRDIVEAVKHYNPVKIVRDSYHR
jgi:hypothetical protein